MGIGAADAALFHEQSAMCQVPLVVPKEARACSLRDFLHVEADPVALYALRGCDEDHRRCASVAAVVKRQSHTSQKIGGRSRDGRGCLWNRRTVCCSSRKTAPSNEERCTRHTPLVRKTHTSGSTHADGWKRSGTESDGVHVA
jgi:hypothetical protein